MSQPPSAWAPGHRLPWRRALLAWGLAATLAGGLVTWQGVQFGLAANDGTDGAGMASLSFLLLGAPTLVTGVAMLVVAGWRRRRPPHPRRAGWRHDPWREAQLRYWDGRTWTGFTAE